MTLRALFRRSLFFIMMTAFFLVGASAVHAGPITGSCDERASTEKGPCIAWVKENLMALGCFTHGMTCNLHPWASDFTKSWNCTTQSENCEIATAATCPAGSTLLFRDGWYVCRKGQAPSSFNGLCVRANGDHPFVARTCEKGKEGCLSSGGIPSTCSQTGSDWQAACTFREMRIRYPKGSSCEALRHSCEESNSPLGPSGTLTRCLSND